MSRDGHFRAHARKVVALGVELRAPGATRSLPAKLVDLGLGGACCETGVELLPSGVTLTVDIDAPTRWDPLCLPATVVWSRKSSARGPAHAGLRFDHHDPELAYALFELLGATSYSD
jgi:hypothetical protein